MPPIDNQPLQSNLSRPEVANSGSNLESSPGNPELQAAPSHEVSSSQPSSSPVQAVTPSALAQVPQVGATQVVTTTAPSLSTETGDTLDKVWVDRANDIIRDNASNPRAEEQMQEDLSAAYLKQRFGLEIKRSNPAQK